MMLGAGKYDTIVRLLKYMSGLATPIPSNLPTLVNSGWSTLGEEPSVVKEIDEVARRNSAPSLNILSVKGGPLPSTDIVPPTNPETIKRDLPPYIDIVSTLQESLLSSDIAMTIEPEPSVCGLKDSSEESLVLAACYP